MMESAKVQPGDLYCPFCFDEGLSMQFTRNESIWECGRGCGRVFDHPFMADADGRFTWIWDDKHPRPNPGCPWCGSCNLSGVPRHDDQNNAHWQCRRQSCDKRWIGRWNRHGNWSRYRWTIRIPCSEVPWASGTIADLECWRRIGHRFDITAKFHQSHTPACCRWPKSCSAYDPGFTIGHGPTTLPIVWNDGYGWRSGAPLVAANCPPHLATQIQARWDEVKPKEEEVSDDDGCSYCTGNRCAEYCG